MKPTRPAWLLILVLAIVKFILPFILQSPVYELQRDEYLYYQQGLHFDLGYLENPPLLSYLGAISSWMGGTEFSLKLWAGLFGALTVVVTCLITAEWGGKSFAQLLAGLGILTGAYMRIHALFQPNTADIFFWTLSVYFLICFIRSQSSFHLQALAISLALGWWSKYSILFLIASLFISLLLSKHRNIFLQKRMYAAILLAAIIIAPNLWWQYDHGWPVVNHMRELRETQLQYLNASDFIKDQFLMTIPVVLIWMAGLLWLLKHWEFRFLVLTYLFVIILLITGGGKSYYSLGIYPMLLAAGGAAWQQWTNRRKWPKPVLISLILLLSILFIPLLLPVWKPEKLAKFYKKFGIDKTGILRWEDLKDHELPQDFADMLGWKELSGKTEKFFNTLPDSTKSNTIIYCRNYGQAGSLKFYGKDDYFKDKVISDNGSFLLWISDRLWFKHLIFIGRRMPDKDDEVFQHFEKTTIVDSVKDKYSRQLGDKIIFFENIDSTGLRLARDGIKEMKSKFHR